MSKRRRPYYHNKDNGICYREPRQRITNYIIYYFSSSIVELKRRHPFQVYNWLENTQTTTSSVRLDTFMFYKTACFKRDVVLFYAWHFKAHCLPLYFNVKRSFSHPLDKHLISLRWIRFPSFDYENKYIQFPILHNSVIKFTKNTGPLNLSCSEKWAKSLLLPHIVLSVWWDDKIFANRLS